MKFINFGDLVEVTYDDGSIELVSKEEAYTLGYKKQIDYRITYKGKVYNSAQLSKLTGISVVTICKYYNKGLHTGEEIVEAYEKQKETIRGIIITYQGKVYNSAQLSKLIGITHATIIKYYNKGFRTGEEILEAYNKQKENRYKIIHQDKVLSSEQFSKLTGISSTTVHSYYNKGLRTGEEMIKEYDKYKITYQGKVLNSEQFSKLTGISGKTIRNYYNKGLRTGEEIIDVYNKQKENKYKIVYQGQIYNSEQFSSISGLSSAVIYKYYNKGLRTGEEMIATYNKQKQPKREIRITYQGKEYNSQQFSDIARINVSTVLNYYNKGLRTGEEMIATYNKQTDSTQEISVIYQGQIYNCNKFSNLTGIPYFFISKYFNKGLHNGEEVIEAYNKRKEAKQEIRITYQGQEYNRKQFSELTGISYATIVKYCRKGLRIGEEMIERYKRNKR